MIVLVTWCHSNWLCRSLKQLDKENMSKMSKVWNSGCSLKLDFTSVGSIGILQAPQRGDWTLKPRKSLSETENLFVWRRPRSHCNQNQNWAGSIVVAMSPVIVGDTVNPAVWVHSEGLTLQLLSADHTAKTGRVVWFPPGLQNLNV